MSVVIHVGYSKTATRWLQASFFPKVTSHKFFGDKYAKKYFVEVDVLDFDPIDVRRHLEMEQGIIFSSEFFLTNSNYYHWAYGAKFIVNAHKIHSVFPDAKIVVFIRRQQSMLCSAYTQYVKGGGTYSFKKYYSLNTHCGNGLMVNYLQYDRIIAYYDSLFGVDNVYVYMFEEFKEDPKKFITKMARDLDITVDTDKISYKVVNVGPRRYIMKLLRVVNLFSKPRVEMKCVIMPIRGVSRISKFIYSRLNRFAIFGNYLDENNLLNVKDVENISNLYSQSNRRLLARRGCEEMQKYGYYL